MSKIGAARDGGTPSGVRERSTVLEVAGHRIVAVSVGGWETCIQLPSYRVAIDVGRCPPSAINMETIGFTHMHVDHVGGIGMHVATRSMRKMRPPTYLVPQGVGEDLDVLLQAFQRLDGSDWEYSIKELVPKEGSYWLGRGRTLRSFPTYHTVPSQGYLVYSERKKLADEYRHMSKAEISALRKSGVDVSSSFLFPEVAVPGDTRIDVLEAEEDVRRASVLVLEITFIDDACTVADARHFGHIHIDEVVEKAHLFQNEAVVFTHFSARYSAEEIERALDARLPADLRAKSYALTSNHKVSEP